MILPFTLDPEVVSVYRTAPAVRSVMKRFDGPKPQGDFTYHGKSKAGGITEHRIREIEEFGDLGTTSTSAVEFFNRHATAATSELDSHLDHWDFMAKHLGRKDVFERTQGFIKRARERIHPACFAISHADSSGSARNSYQEIEDRWITKIAEQRQPYKAQKELASRDKKQSIRQAEITDAKEILTGFRDGVSAWVNEVQAQIQ